MSSFNWKGCVDEVAIYDTALSLAQIRAHFRAGAPGPDFTDIHHSGNSTTMSFTTFPDFSYRIETSGNLTQWFQLGDPVPGDGSVKTATDAASGLRNFYRIRRLP